MPSSMTHTYFGMEVYNKLPNKYKNRINNLEYLKMFSQGPDPFMFYHLRFGKKAKDFINLQTIMHAFSTRDYFIFVISYINDNNLIDKEDVISFLWGYIIHYYLDSYAHPYINYKGGKFDRYDKNTYKYSGIHQKIEFMIDMYYIDKYESINHKKFKTYDNIFKINKFSSSLNKLIDTTINDIYGYKNSSKIFFKSFKYLRYFFRIFTYDPLGIKLKFYHLIDKIMPWYIIRVSELSFYNDIDIRYLNNNRDKWNMPWDKKEVSNESFQDIFDRALNDSVDTIIKVMDMLDSKNINIKELNKIFGDWSYSTGRDSSLNLVGKYYEF